MRWAQSLHVGCDCWSLLLQWWKNWQAKVPSPSNSSHFCFTGFGMMGALSGLCSIDILRKPTQAYISIQESENMDSPFSFLKYFFNFEKSPFQV